MGQWTKPRLLAWKGHWDREGVDYDGPACYELATGGPRGGSLQPHYVGHTKNAKSRMSCYGRDGSHLSEIINDHINRGWWIYYRLRAFSTKEAAEKMERSMLKNWEYDWNILLNQMRKKDTK